MRGTFFGLLSVAVLFAGSAQAAQQLGDLRTRPLQTNCPAGMVLNPALAACVAEAPNGCCAPNPRRAGCCNAAAPGLQRQSGKVADLQSQAMVCPR